MEIKTEDHDSKPRGLEKSLSIKDRWTRANSNSSVSSKSTMSKIHPISPGSPKADEEIITWVNPVQALRRFADTRNRKLHAVAFEDFDLAAELKDTETRILRAISTHTQQSRAGNMSPEAKVDLSPLAQTLTDAKDEFVLALADSSDELLAALARTDGNPSESTKMMSMVGREQPPGIATWNKCARNFRERVVDSTLFQGIVFFFIFLATAAVGTQTHYNGPHHLFLASKDPVLKERGEAALLVLDYLDIVVMEIFLLEAVLKIMAEGSAPFRYFQDWWNVFDMAIVAVGFLPFDTGQVVALRLLRLLRILKMVRALPQLQVIIRGMILAFKQLIYVGGLMLLFFYLFAIFGFILFGDNDPKYFGDLGISMITLWQITTGDDWTEVMYTNMFGCNSSLNSPHYADRPDLCLAPKDTLPTDIGEDWLKTGKYILTLLYFLLFFVVSAIMLVNLVVGVIMIGMMDANEEDTREIVKFTLHSMKRKADKEHCDIPPGTFMCIASVGKGRERKTVKTKALAATGDTVEWDKEASFPLHANPADENIVFEVCRKDGCNGPTVALWRLHLAYGKMEDNIPYRLHLFLKPCAPPGYIQPEGEYLMRFDVRKTRAKLDSSKNIIDEFSQNFAHFDYEIQRLNRMVKTFKDPEAQAFGVLRKLSRSLSFHVKPTVAPELEPEAKTTSEAAVTPPLTPATAPATEAIPAVDIQGPAKRNTSRSTSLANLSPSAKVSANLSATLSPIASAKLVHRAISPTMSGSEDEAEAPAHFSLSDRPLSDSVDSLGPPISVSELSAVFAKGNDGAAGAGAGAGTGTNQSRAGAGAGTGTNQSRAGAGAGTGTNQSSPSPADPDAKDGDTAHLVAAPAL